ncbi:MAG: NifB/NifX family molybdenum-iron cluster-binding protein [Candidatus Helarchaeota archaeon]
MKINNNNYHSQQAIRIAIPCDSPGGLYARISDHFGECDVFTIVEITPNCTIESFKIKILENPDHFNCGVLILRLKRQKVTLIILKSISRSPYEILQNEAIPVYFCEGTVLDALTKFCSNQLEKLDEYHLCKGVNRHNHLPYSQSSF